MVMLNIEFMSRVKIGYLGLMAIIGMITITVMQDVENLLMVFRFITTHHLITQPSMVGRKHSTECLL